MAPGGLPTDIARRMFERDGSLWSADAAVQATARDRLGWLDTPAEGLAAADDLTAFVQKLRAEGFTHAAVLGMGGSSLAPEVLRETFGIAPGFLKLDVLDTTDATAIAALRDRLDLQHTLFIVASKSGTTIEPLVFMEYFWSLVPNGGNFVAITDPGSHLERTASERGFRRVFRHPPDVGGRYAALTPIGMVPAACLGIDVRRLLERAVAAVDQCRNEHTDSNPGLRLGLAIGGAACAGRDKLTLVCSPGISTFGYWVEQLVAESTGKTGTGIVPVEGETLGDLMVYGDDRCFVYLRLRDETDPAQDAAMAALKASGHPVHQLDLTDRYDLGAQFLIWEFAVPVASIPLGVEPFDQPNVQESKDNTNRLLSEFLASGRLPAQPPLFHDGALSAYARGPVAAALSGVTSVDAAVRGLLALAGGGDYFAITAYVPPTAETEAALDAMRIAVRDRLHVATTSGYGPRFLHSTGQLHKGGSNAGVFLQITSDPADDLAIPGHPYSFGTLKAAQALGDLQSLQSRDRRALRIHLGTDVNAGLRRLVAAIEDAMRG